MASTDFEVRVLQLDEGNTKLSGQQKFWVRSTVCCQRSNNNWLITHEHISLPVDFRSGTTYGRWMPWIACTKDERRLQSGVVNDVRKCFGDPWREAKLAFPVRATTG